MEDGKRGLEVGSRRGVGRLAVAGAPRGGVRDTGASAAGGAHYDCGAQASSGRSGLFPESTWRVSRLRLIQEEQRREELPVFSSSALT
jgi:hypothetical protein